jgi:hypothetical protein
LRLLRSSKTSGESEHVTLLEWASQEEKEDRRKAGQLRLYRWKGTKTPSAVAGTLCILLKSHSFPQSNWLLRTESDYGFILKASKWLVIAKVWAFW